MNAMLRRDHLNCLVWMRLFICISLLAACAACTDPKAVQTFAGMAPDPAIVQGLTNSYVEEPSWRGALNVATNVPPDPNLPERVAQRTAQARGIVANDAAIREYMKSLGALASDTVVQSSSNVNDLTSGLKAWQNALPALGITDADVTLIQQFVQATTDLAEAGWRSANLAAIIGRSQEPFQRLLDIQIAIVQRGIIPSINEYPLVIGDKQKFLQGTNPLVHYVADRDLAADKEAADVQLAAASAYVKALKEIQVAHTALYKNRDKVLTRAMFDQIKGPAQEASKAFQDYQAAVAAGAH